MIFARVLSLFAVIVLALPAAAETRVPQSQTEISLGFAPLVKQAAPAVVNIYAKRVVQQRSSPFQDDPFFRQFFGGKLFRHQAPSVVLVFFKRD